MSISYLWGWVRGGGGADAVGAVLRNCPAIAPLSQLRPSL